MSFKNDIICLLKSKDIQPTQIDANLFQIIDKNNYKSFRQLGLVGIKKQQALWNQIQTIKNKYNMAADFIPQKQQIDLSTIHTRFPIKNTLTFCTEVRAVIYGPCGHGKTTAINHICGTNFDAYQDQTSLTKQITQSQSRIKFNPPFKIIDTPGTTSNSDKLKHAMFLRQSLSWKPLNTVFLLAKLHSRYDQILLDLLFQAEIMKDYLSNVVILATHLDCIEEPKKLIQAVNSLLAEQNINCQVVYFSNKYCNEQEFCRKIYEIARSMPQKQIEIDDKQFLRNFNLKKTEKQQLLFAAKEKKLINEILQIGQMYIQCAKQIQQSIQKPDIVQDLAIHLKSQLSQLFERYVSSNKQMMAGLDYYITFFSLQTKIADTCEEFQKQTVKWRKEQYSHFGATGTKTDVRDLFKECPNCKLIWYRIEACPNSTCGTRPNKFWDFFKTAFFRYQIRRVNGKIKIVGKQKYQYDQSGRALKEAEFKKKSTYSKAVGCGAAMNFDLLPRLANIENILIQLSAVQTLDNVINKLTNAEYLKQNQNIQTIHKQAKKEVEEAVRNVLN